MRWVTSVAGPAFGNHFLRLGLALALAAPVAMAQQGGNGATNHDGAAGYNRNSNAPSAPRFTSTFGPQSVVVPGRGTVGRRGAPDYAASWGIVNRGGGQHEGHHDRDRDRHRSGYAAFPIYNPWALMPWDYGYLDNNGYPTEESGAEPAPQGEAGPPQDEQYRRSYPPAENDYAPPPPRTAMQPAPPASAAPAPVASPAPVSGEPALTLIFKDGRHQSVRNYAVTRNSVIVLDDAASGRQQRIPLAELDLGATKQAAELAGLDFNPPA